MIIGVQEVGIGNSTGYINAGIRIDAEIKAIKQVVGKLKLKLAQFVELHASTLFTSAIDKTSQNQLARIQD